MRNRKGKEMKELKKKSQRRPSGGRRETRLGLRAGGMEEVSRGWNQKELLTRLGNTCIMKMQS